jgi:hypothetical protein
MKPIKIEPTDIRVTFEITASELRLLDEYLEISEPLVNKIYDRYEEKEKCLKFVHDEVKELVKETLRLAGELDGS